MSIVLRGSLVIKDTPGAGSSDPILSRDSTSGAVGVEVPGIPSTLNDGNIFVGNASNVATGVTPSGKITLTNAGAFGIATGAIVNAEISASAAIALTKLAATTANRVAITDASGFLSTSNVTNVEIAYVSGVTSAIQTQLNTKQATITGAATTITSADLVPNFVLVGSASGKVVNSTISTTKLNYLTNVTSDIQNQFSNKLSFSSAITPTEGDIVYYDGANWLNLPKGTNGQLLVSTASTIQWQTNPTTGLPTGGTTGQYLNKIDGTDYNVQWSDLTLSKITDVTATVGQVNVLATGFYDATSSIQTQLNLKLSTSLANNAIFVGNASNVAGQLSAGSNGQVLTVVGGVPQWQTIVGTGSVTSVDVSGGTTGLTTTGGPISTTGTITITGTLIAANGGTGFATYTVGDLLQSNTTTTLSKLAAVATGNVLISGGVGTVSSWGKVGLATHVSGTLPVANGGTNITTYTTGDILYASASNVLSKLAAGTNTYVLTMSAGVPVWSAPSSVATFVGLPDGPGAFTGQSLKGLRVNAGETALEYTTLPTGTVTTVSVVTANGISGSVATDTTTPAITLALGNITPTSIGSATTVTTQSAGDNSTKIASTAYVDLAGALKSNLYLTHNTQVADYVLVLTDKNSTIVEMDVATIANTVTIPPNSSVAFPIGTQIPIVQYGTGTTSLVAGVGVTINSSSGTLDSPGQYSPMVIEKRATDEWYLWNGSAASGGVTSVSGTTNRITSTGGVAPIIDISASYIGQSSITTVGTLTSGATGTGFTIALGSSTITGDLSFSNLTQGSGLSVLGVTGNSTADHASIQGTTDQVLRINGAGNALAFGSIDLSKSATVGTSILPLANGGTGSATQIYWGLSGTSTFSAAVTITSNTTSGLTFNGSFTTTANNQFARNYGGTYTVRNTAGEEFNANIINPLIAAGAATQTLSGLKVIPTFTPGAHSPTMRSLWVRGYSGGAVLYLDSDAAAQILRVTNAGVFVLGTSGDPTTITPGTRTLTFGGTADWGNASQFVFQSGNNVGTSGSPKVLQVSCSPFSPTSGTANYTMVNVTGTINQTGTASGSNWGLLINPTYTSALGVSYGIDFNPAVTSASTIYGILSRPTTSLSGFGTGTPTATLHVVGTTKLEGSVTLPVAGNGILIKEGTNATSGTGTLVGGTVTINNTSVTANSRIQITVETPGGTQGFISYSKVASTSFTVTSTSATETSTFSYLIINPAP